MNKENIVIITGGTGGHVIPAVNFGNYLIENGHKCFLFVDERGKKFSKKFNGKTIKISSYHLGYSFFGKIKFIFFLPIGFFKSLFYLIKIRPTKAIAFGGYASFIPLSVIIFISIFFKINIYLHEQNSVMGKVNLIFARFAKKIFLHFPKTLKVPNSFRKKIIITGLPYEYRFKFDKRIADTKERKKILILGGSQGAVKLNMILCKIFNNLPLEMANKIDIEMQSPKYQSDKIKNIFAKLNIRFKTNIFYNDVLKKLNETDILISRSGAGATSDVINTKTPTIFIPLPHSSNNHQYYNAKYLSDQNACILINQNELEQKESVDTIINLINDDTLKNKFINNLIKIEKFDSNLLILNEMKENYKNE